ncbi:hypothetical protein SK128_000170, partial [Halocaridina rubra]
MCLNWSWRIDFAEFGLSKEVKARAEADLQRILMLASHSDHRSHGEKHFFPSHTSSFVDKFEICESKRQMTPNLNTCSKKSEIDASPVENLTEEALKKSYAKSITLAAVNGLASKVKLSSGHG